jgi:hypothetical protein
MKTSVLSISLYSLAFLIAFTGTSEAQPQQQIKLLETLDGTHWCSSNQHTRLDVDIYGNVSTKEGKDICLSFTRKAAQLVTRIVWWNASKGIHVVEWAVAAPVAGDRLTYTECTHAKDSGFPGIQGQGTLVLRDKGFMEMTQQGNLTDGSAAGFVTTLKRVAKLPEIPVSQTYPTHQ